jgi:hypothetical protein
MRECERVLRSLIKVLGEPSPMCHYDSTLARSSTRWLFYLRPGALAICCRVRCPHARGIRLCGGRAAVSAGYMHLWRLNIRTGKCVEERDIAKLANDFAQVPADCVGRPCRYAYAAHFVAGFDIAGVSRGGGGGG